MADLPRLTSLKNVTSLKQLTLRLSELNRGPQTFEVSPDEAARAEVAADLGLVALPAYTAKATLRAWLDGAEIEGTWTAEVVQTCGISLDDFASPLSGAFTLHVLPAGSPNAPSQEGEVELDPDADDPPDVIEDDLIDVGAYLSEQLGLAIDPFPRKPGAVFEPPEPETTISPFAALKALKPD